VASRIPVPPLLLLTKPQMQQIFLLTEVLLPLGVLVIGAVYGGDVDETPPQT